MRLPLRRKTSNAAAKGAQLEYVFRGTVPADVAAKLSVEIQKALPPGLTHLWTNVHILSLGRPTPS